MSSGQGQVPGSSVPLAISKCDRVPALHGVAATSDVPLQQSLLTLYVRSDWEM